jgi:DNA-binding NtrC family response regulator
MAHGCILMAEDDPMIQKILARMIKRSGFEGEVKVCDNAADALDFAKSVGGALDLILMDTNLHSEGDAAFFREMRVIAPTAPIVASSGHSEHDLRGPAHFGGCELFAVLSKPFGLQDVKDLITSLNL